MTTTVGQLAEWVGGEVLGDAAVPIVAARAPSEARTGDITLVRGSESILQWQDCGASAAVVSAVVRVAARPGLRTCGRPVIRVADPSAAFDRIAHRLGSQVSEPAVHPTARLHPTVRLGARVTVGPHVSIDAGAVIEEGTTLHAGVVVGRDCRIGAGVVLHPGVVVYDDTVIDDRSVVHAGATLGADGFGYRCREGRHVKVQHVGWIEVGEGVEVGSRATLDRGTFGPTRIGAGTRIGGLVMVAHNCQIGPRSALAPQVGVAGSTVLGDRVTMALQSGVIDHIRVGNDVGVGMQTAVIRDVDAGQRVIGSPARPVDAAKDEVEAAGQLPQSIGEVRRINRFLGLTAE